MKILFFLMVASCGRISINAQTYNISRQIYDSDDGKYGREPDIIRIPPSLCSNRTQGETECRTFGATKIGNCECVCNSMSEISEIPFLNASTFGFYNGNWKCESNDGVRQQSGCLLALGLHIDLYQPIATLSSVHTVEYIISRNEGETFDSSYTCSVNKATSKYMKCNGAWEKMNRTVISKRFSLKFDALEHSLVLVVNSSGGLDYPLPSGHLIKLGVTCKMQSNTEEEHCITMKIQGDLECPISDPAQSPPRQGVRMPTPSLLTTASIPTFSSHPQITTTTPILGNTESQGKDYNQLEQVGYILGGVTILAIIIMVMIVLVTKRKMQAMARRSKSNNSTNSTRQIVENDSFEQGVDSMFEFKPGGQEHENAYCNAAFPSTMSTELDEEQKENKRADHVYYNTAISPKPPIVDHNSKKPFKSDKRKSVSNQFYGTIEVLEDKSAPSSSPVEPTNKLEKHRPSHIPSSTKHSDEDPQTTISDSGKNTLKSDSSLPEITGYNVPEPTKFHCLKRRPPFGPTQVTHSHNLPESPNLEDNNEPESGPFSGNTLYNIPESPYFRVIKEHDNEEMEHIYNEPGDIFTNPRKVPAISGCPSENEPETRNVGPKSINSMESSSSDEIYDILQRPSPQRGSLYGTLIGNDGPHTYSAFQFPKQKFPNRTSTPGSVNETPNDEDIYQYIA